MAMASAAITVPWFILLFFLEDRTGPAPKVAEAGLLLVGVFLTVYLLLALQRLAHEKYAFREADTAIGLLIKVNVVAAAVSIVGLALPQFESALGVFGIIMAVVMGIMQIVFGIRLLRLPGDLQGLHKPFCYLNIIAGICVATIVLMPIGMVAGAVTDVMLGTIFFQAASAVE